MADDDQMCYNSQAGSLVAYDSSTDSEGAWLREIKRRMQLHLLCVSGVGEIKLKRNYETLV